MLFQAHRGVSSEFPENTMPAFEAALEQGYQVIELDPVFTADGQCIVFHDNTINRTCRTLQGEEIQERCMVCDLTYEQILQYDAGIYMGEQFKSTKVPLLSQALDFIAKSGLLVKLDNRFEGFNPQQKETFFRIVENSNARVAFTCATIDTIQYVAERFPTAEIHYDGFVDEPSVLAVKALLKNNPLTVWLAYPCRRTEWVKLPKTDASICAMVKKHAKLGIWILDTEEQFEAAVSYGADLIETNGTIKPR